MEITSTTPTGVAMVTSRVVRDGADGRDGVDGKDGVDGEDGRDGTNGHDGRDATLTAAQTAALAKASAEPAALSLTITKGTGTRTLAVVVRDLAGAAIEGAPVRIVAPTGLASLGSIVPTFTAGQRVSVAPQAQAGTLNAAVVIDALTDAQGRVTVSLALTALTFSGLVLATCGNAKAVSPGT